MTSSTILNSQVQKLQRKHIKLCLKFREETSVTNRQSTTEVLQSNEQSLHVDALWVIFMAARRNGDKQICSIYLSSVSLRFLMVYPNTRLSWFTRQLDLEMMFTSTISLRTANWIKREKLFTDLVALSTGSTYSLDLFIWFGNLIYSIWWLYLLALFIHWLYLFC